MVCMVDAPSAGGVTILALTRTLSSAPEQEDVSWTAGGNKEVSGRRGPKQAGVVWGSRVTLRDGAFDDWRPHLHQHARHGDLGTVVAGSRVAWPGWIHVRFDHCSTVHRLAEDEIS